MILVFLPNLENISSPEKYTLFACCLEEVLFSLCEAPFDSTVEQAAQPRLCTSSLPNCELNTSPYVSQTPGGHLLCKRPHLELSLTWLEVKKNIQFHYPCESEEGNSAYQFSNEIFPLTLWPQLLIYRWKLALWPNSVSVFYHVFLGGLAPHLRILVVVVIFICVVHQIFTAFLPFGT